LLKKLKERPLIGGIFVEKLGQGAKTSRRAVIMPSNGAMGLLDLGSHLVMLTARGISVYKAPTLNEVGLIKSLSLASNTSGSMGIAIPGSSLIGIFNHRSSSQKGSLTLVDLKDPAKPLEKGGIWANIFLTDIRPTPSGLIAVGKNSKDIPVILTAQVQGEKLVEQEPAKLNLNEKPEQVALLNDKMIIIAADGSGLALSSKDIR
jgi:hypothetical protein